MSAEPRRRAARALAGLALVLSLAPAVASADPPAAKRAAAKAPQPGPTAAESKPAKGEGAAGFPEFSFTSKKEPIDITAEKLDFDYKSRRTTFRGNVEVVQGDVHLVSDVLTVDLEEGSKDQEQKLRAVHADGHVTITQGARKATGDRAVFDQTTRTMILTGNGVLQEGLNQVKGEKITVYPDESRMEVTGENSRVKVTLFPGQGQLGKPTPQGQAPKAAAEPTPAATPSVQPAQPQASSDGASQGS
jgi:lipopolysaccharide transport protein LptA